MSPEIPLPTHAEVERYLRESLEPPHDDESDLDVEGVDPSTHGDYFLRKHRLFVVRVLGDVLETVMHPSSNSCGLFATDGAQMWYLSGRPAEVGALLRREALPLERLGPWSVAGFLAATLLDRGNTRHYLIGSSDELDVRGDGGDEAERQLRGDAVDEAERRKYEGSIRPASVLGSAEEGWRVEFCALSGIAHPNVLTRHVFLISPAYELSAEREVLSSRVYGDILDIQY